MVILKDQMCSVTSKTDFSEFLRVLHKDDRCLAIDRGNIKMAFDSLRVTAIQEDKGREEEQRKAQEKEVRHREQLEEAFHQMLHDSKIHFEVTDKWLSVHDRLVFNAFWGGGGGIEIRPLALCWIFRVIHWFIDRLFVRFIDHSIDCLIVWLIGRDRWSK